MPPLRQRREDIPLLAEHFLRRFGAEHGRAIRGFTPEAMRRLESYDFPGNVRELENSSSARSRCSSGTVIGADDIPDVRAREAGARERRPSCRPKASISIAARTNSSASGSRARSNRPAASASAPRRCSG